MTMRVVFLCLLMLPFVAYGNDDKKLSCGVPLTPKNISHLLLKHKGLKPVEVIEEMSACANDPLLERLLFLKYSMQGDCHTALDFMDNKKTAGSKAFPSTNDYLDHENVLFCYYLTEQYTDTVLFYENRIILVGFSPSLMAREAYAQSLYADGRLDQAIGIFKEIERVDYAQIKEDIDRATYENAILALSQLLFVKGEFDASLKKAKHFLTLQPDSAEGYEVILTAVVQLGVDADIDMPSLYCDALRLHVEDLSFDPESVKMDLVDLKAMILDQGGAITCE